MRLSAALSASSLALALVSPVRADVPTPAPPGSAAPKPRAPQDLVSFVLEDTDLNELLKTMSELTGKRFIIAAHPKSFKATIFSTQKVTVAEAYEAFLSILHANGLTVLPQGRFLKVVDAQNVMKQPTPVTGAGEPATAEERYVTRIHRLAHVGAEDAATLLKKFSSLDGTVEAYTPTNVLIVTDTGTNLRRLMRIVEEIDVGGPAHRMYVQPLNYISSSAAAKKVEEVLDLKATAPVRAVAAPDPKSPAPSVVAVVPHVAKIVPLDRPNAIVIVATEAGYARVFELIKRIDVATSTEGQFHVVRLKHADAKKTADAIEKLVSGAGQPAQAQGAPNAALAILEAPVKVSAEESTQSLLITASARDFASISEVIHELDRPRRQVFIEAIMMDLSMERTRALSVALHGFFDLGDGAGGVGGNNPLQSVLFPGDGSGLKGGVFSVRGPSIPVPDALSKIGLTSIPSIGAVLTAVATDLDSDIMQMPSVTATDNEYAELRVQVDTALNKNAVPISFLPGASPAGSAATGINPVGPNGGRQKIGPKLKVRPHITDGGELRLDIDALVSDFYGDPEGNLQTISFLERQVTTTFTVKDGQLVVIAGLVRDKKSRQQSKVPFFGDIPVLGMLFRSSMERVEKSNLLIFIVPHILNDDSDSEKVRLKKEAERQQYLDHNAVFGDESHDFIGVGTLTPKNGLLGAIWRAHADVAAGARILQNGAGAPPKMQTPQAPLPTDALPPTNTPPPNTPAPTPPTLQVTAPARTLDRVEH